MHIDPVVARIGPPLHHQRDRKDVEVGEGVSGGDHGRRRCRGEADEELAGGYAAYYMCGRQTPANYLDRDHTPRVPKDAGYPGAKLDLGAFRLDDLLHPQPHHARTVPGILELVDKRLNHVRLAALASHPENRE